MHCIRFYMYYARTAYTHCASTFIYKLYIHTCIVKKNLARSAVSSYMSGSGKEYGTPWMSLMIIIKVFGVACQLCVPSILDQSAHTLLHSTRLKPRRLRRLLGCNSIIRIFITHLPHGTHLRSSF